MPSPYGGPTIGDVIGAGAELFEIPAERLASPYGSRAVIDARHVTMAAARALTGASYPDLARAFGLHDHTSVMHAVRRVEGDPRLSHALAVLTSAAGGWGEVE